MEAHASRTRQRTAMHVVTQWQPEQPRLQSATRLAKSSSGYLRPDPYVIPHRTPNRIRQSPSLGLLAPSPIEKWDIGSIRHVRQYSDQDTPTSSVESVFELPSGEAIGSPNSSTYSQYVAELEDTSLHVPKISSRSREYSSPVKARAIPPPAMEFKPTSPAKTPVPSPSTMEFRTAQMTSRAVIKVIDETIAAIEDTNRQLLSRALAAEEVAHMMQERNLELEFKIKHYSQTHHRPNTAPAQPSESRRPRHRSATTPVSTFNNTMNQAQYTQRQTQSQLPPPRNPSISLSIPLSRPINLDLAPTSPYRDAGFPSPCSPRPSPLHPSPPSYTNSRCQPESHTSHPQCPLQTRNNPRNLQISTIIPGSVSRHEVTYAGTPLSCAPRAEIISLAEARRRAKPLPPLGPMSPSVLRGVVEIGASGREQDSGFPRDARHKDGERNWGGWGVGVGVEKRQRGLSGLFGRKGKRDCFF